MKRFGLLTLALTTFVMANVMMTRAALAAEDRIYMGLNIPPEVGVDGCAPADEIQIADVVYPIAMGTSIGNAGFNSFLAWVNATYGGDDHPDFGYTVTDTRGYYQGVTEESRVMLLFFAHDTAVAIGTRFQQAFCQDSVYVNTTAVAASERIPPLED